MVLLLLLELLLFLLLVLLLVLLLLLMLKGDAVDGERRQMVPEYRVLGIWLRKIFEDGAVDVGGAAAAAAAVVVVNVLSRMRKEKN